MATTSARPALRRVLGALVVTALLIGAALVNQRGDRLPATTPVADGSGPESEAVTDGSTDGSASPYRPTGGVAPVGPGMTEPGVLVVATADDTGVDVQEWLLLAEPVGSLALDVPDVASLGVLADAAGVRAVDLVVDADGAPVRGGPDEVSGPVTLELPRPVVAVALTYRLLGVAERSEPSSSGRALAVVGSLLGAAAGPDDGPDDGPDGGLDELPVTVVAPGAGVLNLACPDPEGTLEACAAGVPPLLRTDAPRPLGEALVALQLDVGPVAEGTP